MKNIITYKNEEITIDKLVSLIQEKLMLVEDNHPSQYINIGIENDLDFCGFTIRVSNHSAKKINNSNQTLSFITDTCNQGYSGMGFNEYVVEDIEDMDTNETTSKGWLSVKSIIEDFIEDYQFNR